MLFADFVGARIRRQGWEAPTGFRGSWSVGRHLDGAGEI